MMAFTHEAVFASRTAGEWRKSYEWIKDITHEIPDNCDNFVFDGILPFINLRNYGCKVHSPNISHIRNFRHIFASYFLTSLKQVHTALLRLQ